MKRTQLLQEIRKMRFKEAYEGWQAGRLTQPEAARLLGVCDRTFRRYLQRYEEDDMAGLIDRRLGAVSHRRAPVDEVMKLVGLYRRRYEGWNVKHFHSWYRREHQGARSYSWVKKELQGAGAVPKAAKRGAHRKRRERAADVAEVEALLTQMESFDPKSANYQERWAFCYSNRCRARRAAATTRAYNVLTYHRVPDIA